MSEIIKALIFISTVSYISFWTLAKMLPVFITKQEFVKWRNAWLLITAIAFISQNILLVFISVAVIWFITTANLSRVQTSCYLSIICTLPLLAIDIPGVGGIQNLFEISYPRFLSILLLLNVFNKHLRVPRLYTFSEDKYVVLFVLISCILTFRGDNATNAIRASFVFILDIVVPYYLMSRYIDSSEQLNKAFFALLFCVSPFALIGMFEFSKHWLLYSSVVQVLIPGHSFLGFYDMRAGGLRATAVFASPIVLGYVMVVAFGLFLYLKPMLPSQKLANFAALAIAGCLIATMARGPWIGFIVLCFVYIWTGRNRFKRLLAWGSFGSMLIIALSFTDAGQKMIDLLPFIGTTRSDTVDYRAKLLEAGWIVFQRNPWFGSINFLQSEEMESLRQGQGIIDIVNTYIRVALTYGIVGLALFLGAFLNLLFRCQAILRRLPKNEIDLIRMGRVLLAILCSTMVTIFTVSSIDYIPKFYWLIVGITTAYLFVAQNTIRTYSKSVLMNH